MPIIITSIFIPVNSRFDTHLLSFQGLCFEHQQVTVPFEFTVEFIFVERENTG